MIQLKDSEWAVIATAIMEASIVLRSLTQGCNLASVDNALTIADRITDKAVTKFEKADKAKAKKTPNKQPKKGKTK